VVVDAQRDLGSYKKITSMTPNLPDAQKSVGFCIENEKDLQKAGAKLLKDTGAKSVLITCGANGMYVCEAGRPVKFTKIPVFNKSEVFDVTGAGDTVTAVYTLALAAGLDAVTAAVISNTAASIVVKQFGCATTTINELVKICDARASRRAKK
jgi:rfaE bifunctional protein kinase chain/domain